MHFVGRVLLLIIIRILLIGLSLILLSEIPSTESVFFKARIAFYAMLFLDYINMFKSNNGFEKHFSGFGAGIIGLICVVDTFGLFNFIQLSEGIISPNNQYILMKWFPTITFDQYVISLSLLTAFLSGFELILKFGRYLGIGEKQGKAAEA
jgi:hypothetical protein